MNRLQTRTQILLAAQGFDRRRRTALGGFALMLAGPGRGALAQPAAQGDAHPQARFVAAALAQRERAVDAGDQAFGAVVVFAGEIVGLGPSRVLRDRDPTAHAEMQAIRDACRHLGRADLSGGVLYSSFRPCPMCETAAYWARLDRFYYGADGRGGGAPGYCG